MSPETLQALSAFAQFAGGAVVGFLVSIVTTYINARTKVMQSVLTEVERDETDRRHAHRRDRSDRALPYVIVIVMAAMLLAGVSWIKSGQEDAENRRNDCIRAAAVAQALRQRTDNYIESATSQQQLWRDLREQLVDMGAGPNSALVDSIERHLHAQRLYLDHLRDNPVPPGSAKDC